MVVIVVMILRVDENKVTDFIDNAKNFLDYSTGKVTDKDLLKDLVDAEDSEIESFPELNDFIKEFKGDNSRYQVMVDGQGKGNNFIVSFSAKSVPTDLADKVKPGGEYFNNILNYDKNSKEVEMIFTKKKNESVMAPTPTPYEMELNVKSDEDDLSESKNPFKDHHICQGCGKPLSQCTCKVEGLEESYYSDEDVQKIIDSYNNKVDQIVKAYRKLVSRDPDHRKDFLSDLANLRNKLSLAYDNLKNEFSESLKEDADETPDYEAVGVKEMPDGTYELQCIDHSYNDEEFTKYIGRPGTPTAKKNASLFFRDKTLYFKDKELENHIKSMFLEECTQPSNIGQYKVDDKLNMFN